MGSQARALFYLDRERCRAPGACGPRGAEAAPQDGEAVFDEPASDPPRTTVRRWNFALLGCTVLSRMTPDEAPQLVITTKMQFVGKLTQAALNDVPKDARSNTYGPTVNPARDTQTPTSLLVSAHRSDKHCYRIARGHAFRRILWRGHASREGSSHTQGVSISFADLRPVHWPAGPRSSAGLPRHARVTHHGLPHPYCLTDFRNPTRFRETSASARDRVLSFPVRSQVSAVCQDVQR